MENMNVPRFRFEIFPKRNKLLQRRWYMRVVARNNEIVLQSEGVVNKQQHITTASKMRVHMQDASLIVFEKDMRP